MAAGTERCENPARTRLVQRRARRHPFPVQTVLLQQRQRQVQSKTTTTVQLVRLVQLVQRYGYDDVAAYTCTADRQRKQLIDIFSRQSTNDSIQPTVNDRLADNPR